MEFFYFSLIFFTLHSLLNFSNGQFTEEDLIVEAGDLGKIAGVNTSTLAYTPRQYIAFRGIKYGNAPLGEARFRPSTRFTGKLNETGDTFNAYAAGSPCMQPPVIQYPRPTSEDCLYLNVYIPKPYSGNTSDLLPVIFFIHGGSFTVGESDLLYNGNRLLNRDVVLVSFNYRLGVLGFYSLGTEEVPGNAAMYDMVNALKWTNEYIQYFGGDPNRITIAGQSAGSAAVTHLLVSPLARGLFQSAIGASGTSLAAWATTEDPMRGSLAIAAAVQCYNATSGYPDEAMLQSIGACMRRVPSFSLMLALFNYQINERRNGRLGFEVVSPVVQSFNTTPSFEKFLPEKPDTVMAEGRQADVPLLMGATRHDGSYVLGVFYNRYLQANRFTNDTEFMRHEAVPSIMEALGVPNQYGVYESIAKLYMGDSRKSGNFFEMFPGFIDLFSVFFFKASSYQTALYQAQLNNDTYWYSFDYKGRFTVWDSLFGGEGDVPPFSGGITHGDDMQYLFMIGEYYFNQEEDDVSNRVIDYWVNFASTGNPTPPNSNLVSWSHLTASEAHFMGIGDESEEMQHYDDMWNDVGVEVIPPTTVTTPPSNRTSSGSPPVSYNYNILIILLSMSAKLVFLPMYCM